MNWNVYIVTWNDDKAKESNNIADKLDYNKIETVSQRNSGWRFREIATENGFDRFVPDSTLAGGHFSDPNGDTCHAIPTGQDIRAIFE